MWVSDFLKSHLRCLFGKWRFVNHQCFFSNSPQPASTSKLKLVSPHSGDFDRSKDFQEKEPCHWQSPRSVHRNPLGILWVMWSMSLPRNSHVNFLVLGKWQWGGAQTNGAEPVVFQNFWAFFGSLIPFLGFRFCHWRCEMFNELK